MNVLYKGQNVLYKEKLVFRLSLVPCTKGKF
jgi:hypothetical protein